MLLVHVFREATDIDTAIFPLQSTSETPSCPAAFALYRRRVLRDVVITEAFFSSKFEEADELLPQLLRRKIPSYFSRARRGTSNRLALFLRNDCIEMFEGQLRDQPSLSSLAKIFDDRADLLLRNFAGAEPIGNRHIAMLEIADGTPFRAFSISILTVRAFVIKSVMFGTKFLRAWCGTEITTLSPLPPVPTTNFAMSICKGGHTLR